MYNKKFLGLGGFTVLLIFCAMPLLFSVKVSAYSASISTSDSIKLTTGLNGDDVTIKEEPVTITSNCRSGYNLTIATSESSSLYLNGDSTGTATFTAVNGASALNNSNNTNKWGYTMTSNPTGSTVFKPLSTTATVLKIPSQTASPNSDINDTLSIYYGVNVGDTVNPGSYQMANNGAIVYYLTMDTTCTLYSIQYDGNNATNPNGMGTTDVSTGIKSVRQVNIAENTKVTLLASNFKKTGYGFLGWSTDSDAYAHFTDNDNTNDPIIYGPVEDVIVDSSLMSKANDENIITMYAVWVPALKDGNNNTVYFQDWDNPATNLPHDGCSTLTATTFDDTVTDEKDKITVAKDSFTALTDKRDNMVYAVARLADGNCWMMENFRLEHAGTVGNNINDNSVTNQSLSQGYGGTTGVYGNFVGLADPESTNFDSTTSNSIYKSDGSYDVFDSANNTLEDIGANDSPEYRFPRYKNDNVNSLIDSPTYAQNYYYANNPSETGTFSDANLYSYGNHYTWSAVMANTNRYKSYYASEAAGTSICPSGWHLPSIGNIDKEYNELSQNYGGDGYSQNDDAGAIMSNRFRSFPNNLLYSGLSVTPSGIRYRGYIGNYWTRSYRFATGQDGPYILTFDHESIMFDTNIASGGLGIRCLAGASDIEVTLDSNNGTGAISRVYGVAGSTVTLPYSSSGIPSSSIAVLGYDFKNWNTVPNGSGTSYTSSYDIPAGSTGVTLYAQWSPQYIITYVNNCMSWASGDSNCTATSTANTSTQKIDLDGSGNGSGKLGAYNKFTMTGWKIKEWTTNADGTGTAYPTGSTYSVAGSNPGDSITLYAHWVPSYTVQYDGNGSDNDSTGMGSTNATTGIKTVSHGSVAEGDTFDLYASNFKRAGYGFVGWSTDANAWSKFTDNDTSNDVRIWGPNELFTAPAPNGTPITTLYAVWVPAETSGGNPVYLQGWTGCSAMTATTYNSSTGTLTIARNSVTALTDQRDGNVYAVAKLADGNCWTIENLRLDDTSELSTTNTNINSNNSTLPITNNYNADPSQAITSNYLSSPSQYSWCNSRTAACFDQSRLVTINTTSTATPSQSYVISSTAQHNDLNIPIYSYGNLYNWYSATAGYGTYSSGSGVNVEGDICPAGWKLPYGNNGSSGNNIGNTKGGYYYLANQMGYPNVASDSNKFRSFPNNFIYSGYISNGISYVRGNQGVYWTASARSNQEPYHFHLNVKDVAGAGATNGFYKNVGASVRCISGS